MTEWQIATVIAVLAMMVSAVPAFYAALAYHRRNERTKPHFHAQASVATGQPGWIAITITEHARASHPYSINWIEITKPRGARILGEREALAPRRNVNQPLRLKQPLPADLAGQKLPEPHFTRDRQNDIGSIDAYVFLGEGGGGGVTELAIRYCFSWSDRPDQDIRMVRTVRIILSTRNSTLLTNVRS